ncbi:MAG: hypothetical protein EZS28_021747, partial [Streblomastix strix]
VVTASPELGQVKGKVVRSVKVGFSFRAPQRLVGRWKVASFVWVLPLFLQLNLILEMQ